jgi:hypothetical protein
MVSIARAAPQIEAGSHRLQASRAPHQRLAGIDPRGVHHVIAEREMVRRLVTLKTVAIPIAVRSTTSMAT